MGVRRVFIGWRLRIGSPSLALLGQAVDKHPVHRVQACEYSLMIPRTNSQVLKGCYNRLMRVEDRIHASAEFCYSPSETKDQLSFPI